MNPTEFFELLWQDYVTTTPQAKKIKSLFESLNETVINDHVAFRTLSDCPVELDKLQPLLEGMGYELQDQYVFEKKKLIAKSFIHPDSEVPKIFVSELQRHLMSEPTQQALADMVSQIPDDAAADASILYKGILWQPVSLQTYQLLVAESEYAGWLCYMGLRANHFTVSLNHLKHYGDMTSVIELLTDQGFEMNAVGGVIKGEPEDLLIQSSTMADRIPVSFSTGETVVVPSCFYEFARRFDNASGSLFAGFITNNADKIFESTNTAA